MGSIFTYIDYRQFLAGYCEEKRAQVGFSFRHLNAAAGISSPNYIQRVIAGTRNLSPASTVRLCRALRLGRKESLFFRKLVLFNQCHDPIEKQEYYSVLVSMMNSMSETRLTAQQSAYYDKWYTSVIRELICLFDFKHDYAALAAAVRPPIKAAEARESVELLVRLGIVERHDNECYRQIDPAIVGGGTALSFAVRGLNRQMLLKACEALDSIPKNERHISGITAGVSAAGFDLLVAEFNAFKDRIIALVNKDSALDRVCQINLQLFPLSKAVASVTPTREGTAQ